MAYGREVWLLPELPGRTLADVLTDRIRLLEAYVERAQTEWLAEDRATLRAMPVHSRSAVDTRRTKRRRRRQKLEEELLLPKWRADLERLTSRTSRTGPNEQVLAEITPM